MSAHPQPARQGVPSGVRFPGPRLAWSLCALAVALLGFSVLFAALGRPAPLLEGSAPWYGQAIFAAAGAGAPVLGALIASRRPENPYGWLWLGFGLALAVLSFGGNYAEYAALTGNLPAPVTAAAIGSAGWVAWAALTPLLVLLFPDGRLPSARWRFVAWAVVAAGAACVVLGLFVPGQSGIASVENPFGVGGSAGMVLTALVTAGVFVIFGCTFLAALSLYFRFRRADGVQRQQIKWLVYAAVLFCASLVFSGFLGRDLPGVWDALFEAATLSGLYVAVGIAIFRYRLYDIDLIINRTLVYGALTACVVGVYVLVVGYLGALLQTERNLLVSLVAAGVVAVLFAPLRGRLQRGVNRLMYGERDEPYTVLSRLGRRLEGSLTPEAVLPAIVEDVARALRLPHAAIWLSDGDALRLGAAHGKIPAEPAVRDAGAVKELRRAPDGLRPEKLGPSSAYGRVLAACGVGFVLPLTHRGHLVGALSLAPRGPGEGFSPTDRLLLRDLATQAGAAAHAVGLTAALRSSLADLRRSREKLVAAQEEERRRIQRDLHDGLGPVLASMRLRLEACLDAVQETKGPFSGDLERLYELVGQATTDIRRLVYDLRPPVLDQLGLGPAIRQHCERFHRETGIEVGFEIKAGVPIPAAAEVTLLRVAQEALLNVQKHARASRVDVRLERRDGWISLTVRDDGAGFATDSRGGTGIGSMRERAESLGGTLGISGRSGTEVEARIPIEAER